MLYIDTSILVAALTNEARTSEIQEWLTSQPAQELTVNDWIVAEFSAALSVKLRDGDALHHAIAMNHGARIRALDRGLVSAAMALGISAALV